MARVAPVAPVVPVARVAQEDIHPCQGSRFLAKKAPLVALGITDPMADLVIGVARRVFSRWSH